MQASLHLLSRPGRRRCRWPGLALLVVAATGSAQAQRSEGGDLGASSRSVEQGALQPFGGPAPPPPTAAAPPLPKPKRPAGAAAADATRPSGERDAGTPSPLLPLPTSYMSSAWSFWPHAWAYVPSLWSTWYHDFTVQSTPTTPSAGASAESPPSTTADGATTGETPAPPRLTEQDSQGLPPPRLVRYRRYNLVIAGTGLLVATWAADRLLARDLSNSPETWVPLLGPWFLLGEQSGLASPNRTVQGLLVIDGLIQGAGLTMALLGFVLTTRRYQVTVQPARNEPMPREAP